MMTRFFSPACGRHPATTLLFLSAVVFSLLLAGQTHAQEPVDETALSINDRVYQGTVNFVHADTFKLIVDDYSFVLDPVLRFNNLAQSREQVIQRIEQGNRVRMELGGVADGRSNARTVRRIIVINQR